MTGEAGPKDVRAVKERASTGDTSDTEHEAKIAWKAEMYGIAAYFIEEASKKTAAWLKENPDDVRVWQVRPGSPGLSSKRIETSITVQNRTEYLERCQTQEQSTQAMHDIILGLFEVAVADVIKRKTKLSADNPADKVQQRLESLLEDGRFSRAGDHDARRFVISTLEAPALFVPVVLHTGMDHARALLDGAYPDMTSTENAQFGADLLKLITRIMTMHETDLRKFVSSVQIMNEDHSLRPEFLSEYIQVTRDESGLRAGSRQLDDYFANRSDELKNQTMNCPFLYNRKGDDSMTIKGVWQLTLAMLSQTTWYRENVAS